MDDNVNTACSSYNQLGEEELKLMTDCRRMLISLLYHALTEACRDFDTDDVIMNICDLEGLTNSYQNLKWR